MRYLIFQLCELAGFAASELAGFAASELAVCYVSCRLLLLLYELNILCIFSSVS